VNFLNIGPMELMVILVIAILLVGPKRVVELARMFGRITGEMRRMSSEFLGTIQAELQDTEQEAREALESVAGGGASISDEVQATEQEARQALDGISEDGQVAAVSIRDELQAFQEETGRAMKEMVEGVKGIVKAEQEAEERSEEEAAKA
jgi:Tat protein translocase TatB subunit